eukprot:CAMPEP_0170069556 /NCGR_PEP_ID=MMETSP0019_2-20121128/8184_1 /TAXON_ID=98059 /ORGANISM="Dinobryon sp., Strain UTEXLB2267" /LENGTH=266 /DNA_ID=CAMNT_0010277625 /DNA_START=260 /DNA_END=1060 /DNA_ORIENTATION=+
MVEKELVFVYPCEQTLQFSTFFDLLENNESDAAVPYLSQQNDNLRSEMPILMQDVDESLTLVEELFGGTAPEAVNLWIGDNRSVSSIHKDHYENMYAVIQGEKWFTLFPPTDFVHFPEETYPTGRYELTEEGNNKLDMLDHSNISICNESSKKTTISKCDFSVTSSNCPQSHLSWLPFDPEESQSYIKYPQLHSTNPIRCKVRAGEVLYIPAMWYHRVTQSQFTIAVNYWYDQRFDFRYVFYQTVKSLRNEVKNAIKDQDGDEKEE